MEIEYFDIIFYSCHSTTARMKRIKGQQSPLTHLPLALAEQEVITQEILHRHPNLLHPILLRLPQRDFCPQLTQTQKMRVAALMGLCHPVMNKEAQEAIERLIGNASFWQLDGSTTLLLQVLNIICLIPGINYGTLKIKGLPAVAPHSYEEALWVNALPHLLHGQHHPEAAQQVEAVSKENALRIREFINNLLSLKEKVKEGVYDKEDVDAPSGNYHSLDIQLAAQGILTTDYFPSDYLSEHLQLWLDRTVELNSLLGNFVCKEKFGEFEYIRGPLLYAMQKGILLVLNNFAQISNELLVSLKSLSTESQITLNQKTIRAHAGFKILGILSGEGNSKAKIGIAKLVKHYSLSPKNYEELIPQFSHEQNKAFLMGLFRENASQLGYLGLSKLWRRIERLRRSIIHVEDEEDEQSRNSRLWGSFFTQDFMDSIDLELADLTNKSNHERTIFFQEKYRLICIGRTEVAYSSQPLLKIVKTQYSLKVLEKLMVCFELGEYPLLISETGCGKTTLVQYLAELSGHKLFVYNMSSGTDVTDLIGGFKPIDCRVLLKELFTTFMDKFRAEVPNAEKNEAYLINLNNYFTQGKLELLLKSLVQSIPRIIQQLPPTASLYEWQDMLRKFTNILGSLDKMDSNLVFSFLEGNLIKALRNGDWILIDEINLATNDVLQKIVPLIEGKSLLLYEKGDLNYIERHKDFRIVACMNPANDSGKKPLPNNLAEKFTAICMADPSRPDVEMMVKELCPQLNEYQIGQLFFNIKQIKTTSLRNLARALAYINKNKQIYSWPRSVYDGLMLGFGEKEILKPFLNETIPKVLPGTVEISGFLVSQGPFKENVSQIFHLTDTFKSHLKDFLRAIAGTDLPVLLEGPTSAGKTSMIRFVAETVGHRCIRINNHEHTEIEEYIGNYFPDKSGKLVFREGPLVQAVREGHWLILDELNLAKTEILECLNRLLDDNRELFIPQQQKHIKPHHNFRIFATQNPSSYSGRKTLSRAFRNRFVSISFSDINSDDMMAILQARSPLLKDSKELSAFVKKTLEALINYRQRQRVFEKDGLITIRNLLKWCERKFVNKEKFAMEGYAILAEKLRTQEEKRFVEKVLLTGIKCSVEQVRQEYFQVVQEEFSEERIAATDIYVQMNDSFKRMAALTLKAVGNNEPVLLVGETGCGKTTLAELLAALTHRPFFSINCHKHMEASDLLGSLRPALNPSSTAKFEFMNGVVVQAMLEGGILLIDEINTAEDSVLERLNQVLECGLMGIERGDGWETVQAKEGFCIIATMNPSGDYGKKELSPALRNRFTEIWVEPITHPEYIREAKQDILKMIHHKLAFPLEIKNPLADKIYEFLVAYNCEVAPRYGLARRLLTMRDIGWICRFVNEGRWEGWEEGYFWSILILAVEGVKYIMTDTVEGAQLERMKDELLQTLATQVNVQPQWLQRTEPHHIIALIKHMDFPILLKVDAPLEVLGIQPDQQIFFSPQTDLSDLLGQYRPVGSDFVWRDQALLRCVKEGGVVALVDLNLAQQQVIEGINSLFDHRGSLFVVQLNRTFRKATSLRPIVVLRSEGGHGRKGLPNSFLNRFVKLAVPSLSIDVKLGFLMGKYANLAEDGLLLGVVKQILEKEKALPIQSIEFIIQFSHHGLLNESLEILKLDAYKQAGAVSRFGEYQTSILELLPLKKSLEINTAPMVKTLLQAYLVYRYSRFNLCLVGSSRSRGNLSRALAYLLRCHYVKLLISTMLDINDLLGTYEQVSEGQREGPMEEEGLLGALSALALQESQGFESQATKFVFVESQLVRCLREERNLVYVEAPSEAIAERIEKGLKEVYSLTRKILIGLDTLNSKTTISKFIPIHVPETSTHTLTVAASYAAFPENESSLIASDWAVRQEETQVFIVDAMNEEGGTRAVTAWRRVLECLLFKTNTQEEKLVSEIEEKLRREYIQKWRVGCIQDETADLRTERVLRQVQVCASRDALLSRAMLQCFFTSDPLVLSKRMAFFNADEQALSSTIRKFQILYSCNASNFRETARAVMGVLFRDAVDSPMIRRYFGELQRLHEELLRHRVKETLIQYNEEEYKLIPILSTPEAVRYQLLTDAAPIRALCDQGPHIDHILSGVEKTVGEAVRLMEVEVDELGRWCRDLRVRHIGALDILQATLSKRTSLSNDLRHNRLVTNFLLDIGMPLPTEEASIREYSMSLFEVFRPSKDMSANVSYHLKNEMKARLIRELISEDELFVVKYGQLSAVKYFSHQPNQLHALAAKLAQLGIQLKEVQKLLVYRGHNNIQSLIDFYQRLANHTEQLEREGFSLSAIRTMILETYRSDYLCYSDILLPLYIPLLLLYQQPPEQEGSVAVRAVQTGREDALTLLDAAVGREDGEVDRSKDYLRFQRKFNRTVIVDEYTDEGVEHNRLILETEFQELFGKGVGREESPLDRIHLLINKTPQGYTSYLARHVLGRAECLAGLLVGMETLVRWQESAGLNIYEEGQAGVMRALLQPVTAMMEQIHALLQRYPIDNIKNLATLCSKITDHSLFDEVYKVLTDCEFLIEKTSEVNAILPIAYHVNTATLIQNCLKVRRVELTNWRQMLGLKLRRTERADMIEFLGLYRNVKEVANQRELFVLCERYLRESALSCLPNRLRLLRFLQRTILSTHPAYTHVLRRVSGFFEYLLPWAEKEGSKARKEREKEMREYEKLAGWSSNEYLIFKATCEKFQRKIHHILRRYDEQLSISVGTFHQQLQQQQLFTTIKDFADGLSTLVDIQAQQQDSEEEEDEDEVKEEQEEKEQPLQPSEKPLEQQQQLQQQNEGEAIEQQLDEYETISRRVFGALKELQGDHHNTQSRLLIIRAYQDDLDEVLTGLTVSAKQDYKYLSRGMFGDQQQYLRAVKYYYGLWDKLCQRTEIVAHRELIDKLWLAAEKVWSHVNSQLQHVPEAHPDGIAEDLSVLFASFLNNNKQAQHPLFAAEIQKVREYISDHSTVVEVHVEGLVEGRLVSLMKLGYVLGSIAANLQRNGLCAKEEEQEAAGSGQEEVGDGMGIGEGEAHEGAENVGDQIEYEEQVLGHKDEQKNEDDNAEKKEENDIEMDADFEGQMHSQEEDGEGDSKEGQEKEPDEQMGQVDQEQKEKDMKNEAGEAEGEEEADVDIKGQKEGEDELVDNERQEKEERRGEQQRMEEQQQKQQEEGEGSDWDSNNEEGEKINKQEEDVEAHDKQSNYDIDQERPPEEVDSKQEQMDEESQPADGEQANQQQKQPEEISEEGSREADGEEIEEEPQQQSQQEQEEPQRKSRPSKQQGAAYGRRDMNTNDDVLNKEEQPAEEAGNEGDREQGEGEGGQSSGSAVHNLSADFLEEVLRQQRAEGNEKFMKDLNVLINDQNEPRDAKEEGDQYELTEQKDQFATNLPLLDDQRPPQDKQEQRDKQEDGQERTDEAKKEEAKKEKAEKQADKDKAEKTQQNKQTSANNNSKAFTEQEYEKSRRQEKSLKQQQDKRQLVPEDAQAERLVKQALDRMQTGPQPEKAVEERQGLLGQAVEASKVLQEQLKSVLQPMDSAEYRGDFRTGKKLNLRKIIPFIASNYRKDRIWLRRTEPSERNYYVMVGLDDTKSMQYGAVGEEALKGTVALSLALQHLAIRTSICSIRDQMAVLKGFEDLLDTPRILNSFGFSFESSNSHDLSMAAFMKGSLDVFSGVEGGEGTELRKLCFIISDGKMNKKVVQPFMKDAKRQDVTYIFIIVDSQQSSILNIRTVDYGENKKMRFKSYMADFPFEYFLIINDVRELAEVLAITLMQFIQRQ